MHDRDLGDVIRRAFCFIFCGCEGRDRKREVIRTVTYSFKDVSFTATGDHMELTVKTDSVPGTATATLAFKTAGGKPAKVDGVPTWSISDPTIVDTITVAADGMSADMHITDTVGATLITINADVDLGAGVNNVDFVDTLSVVPSDAASAELSLGAITPDP